MKGMVYFWFYEYFSLIKQHVLWFITTIFVALFLAIWFFGIHELMYRVLYDAEREVRQLRKQVKKMVQVEADSAALAQYIAELENSLLPHSYSSDQSNELTSSVSFVFEQMQKHEIQLQGYSLIQAEPFDKGWYQKQRVQFHALGKMNKILDFYEQLRSEKRMFRVKSIRCDRIDDYFFRVATDLSFMSVKEKIPST